MNNELQEILNQGASEVVTFINKGDNYGVYFHDNEYDPIKIAMLCSVLINNYIDRLADNVQLEATDVVYKCIEKLRNYPSWYEGTR
jgi:hypothetical protein